MKRSGFTEAFVRANQLDFARWRFKPGMFHGDTETWWAEKGQRKHVHYGLDLALYETSTGTTRPLGPGMHIPLLYAGHIVTVMKDFLGHTVVAKHAEHQGCILISLYGHVDPGEKIVGHSFDAGAIIATLSDTGESPVPPHLHLGLALVPEDIELPGLSWDYLNTNPYVTHLDPFDAI